MPFQGRRHSLEGSISEDIKDDVKGSGARERVAARVVKRFISTQHEAKGEVPGTGTGRDSRPERLGDLHGKHADAARGAIDADRGTSADSADVAQSLKRRLPR